MVRNEQVIKSKNRLDINRTLIGIAFTLFGLIIALKPELLKQSFFIPLQLTMSIPMFFSSLFVRSKMPLVKNIKMWEEYSFVTFLLGYAFLINVLGILMSVTISLWVGLVFFLVNIVASFVYSFFEVIENNTKLNSRLKKDMFFIMLLIIGGILPTLGFYV